MSNLYFKRWDSSFSKYLERAPKWILWSGLVCLVIFFIATLAISRYLEDVKNVAETYDLDITGFIPTVFSYKHLAMFCLYMFVVSAAVVLGYFIVPLCHALLDTLFDALFSKDSFKNTSKTEGTIQEGAQSKPQNAKELDNSQKILTPEQRVEGIKPLIVDCFWGSSLWEYGEDNTKKFLNSLKQILGEENNIMKLGHLAYILREKNWTAEKWPNFKDWIITFFEALGMQPPGDTARNKYINQDDNPSPSARTFSEIDKIFEYLLDKKYQATLNKQSRPSHK